MRNNHDMYEERIRRERAQKNQSRCIARRKKNHYKWQLLAAVAMGAIMAAEIIALLLMILNVDYRTMDNIALAFTFMVLFLGIVAGMTD